MVPEDISKRKIIIRAVIVVLAVLYSWWEEYQEEKTIIIRDIYLLAIGYMGTSLINMLYSNYAKGHQLLDGGVAS